MTEQVIMTMERYQELKEMADAVYDARDEAEALREDRDALHKQMKRIVSRAAELEYEVKKLGQDGAPATHVRAFWFVRQLKKLAEAEL